MNRLTAIGLASLVAYGLLIASKYTGVVTAAREDSASQALASQLRMPLPRPARDQRRRTPARYSKVDPASRTMVTGSNVQCIHTSARRLEDPPCATIRLTGRSSAR